MENPKRFNKILNKIKRKIRKKLRRGKGSNMRKALQKQRRKTVRMKKSQR